DAWIDETNIRKGYKILFSQIFYAKNDKIRSKLKNQDTWRLKDISTIIRGVNIKRERLHESGDYLVLKLRNFKNGYIDENDNSDYIDEVLNSNEMQSVLQRGDIIISLFGETFIYYVTGKERPLIVCPAFAIIRSEENVYINTYLNTKEGLDLFKLQTEKKSTQSITINRLSVSDLRLIKIPILPIEDLNKASDKYIEGSNNKEELEALKQELQIQKELND